MVESGHGCEVLSWEILSIMLADKSISVGWVSDNNGLSITSTVVIYGFANIYKDLSIVL